MRFDVLRNGSLHSGRNGLIQCSENFVGPEGIQPVERLPLCRHPNVRIQAR